MRLAENSVQKTKPEIGENNGRDELNFGSVEETVTETLRGAGKTLLVSDGTIFTDAACSPRAISVVFDGDCLPLFSMPDTTARVLASGGEELLRAARYFAEVRGIPCTLIPEDAALNGAFEERGEIYLGDECMTVPLKGAKIVCDAELLKPTLAGAYGRTVLARLAEIEARACAAFRHEEGDFFDAEIPADLSPEGIITANARQRMKERQGANVGEGVILAELLREEGEIFPEWRAYIQLSSLYAAFFEKGKPRRYFTPDYRARAERAGTEYTLSGVPSAEEYVIRAMTLERIRAPFAKAALALVNEKETLRKTISALAGAPLPLRGGDLSKLKILPEHAAGGLSSVIRDFGLMEWEI